MKIVSNTSPLIFLSKLNYLDILLDNIVYVPQQVMVEIEEGKHKGQGDYQIITGLLEHPHFHVIETALLTHLPQNLGEGEAAAISLAVQEKIKLILIDEAQARKVARLYGLEPRGTLGVLLEQFRRQLISKEECRALVFKLVQLGYRISEEVLIELLKELE